MVWPQGALGTSVPSTLRSRGAAPTEVPGGRRHDPRSVRPTAWDDPRSLRPTVWHRPRYPPADTIGPVGPV